MKVGVLMVVLASALASGGCSLAFVTPPPKVQQAAAPAQPIECSTRYTAPIVDTAMAAMGGFFSLLVLAAPCIDECGGNRPLTALGVALPAFVLPLSSAIYGYSKVGSCREAKGR